MNVDACCAASSDMEDAMELEEAEVVDAADSSDVGSGDDDDLENGAVILRMVDEIRELCSKPPWTASPIEPARVYRDAVLKYLDQVVTGGSERPPTLRSGDFGRNTRPFWYHKACVPLRAALQALQDRPSLPPERGDHRTCGGR